METVEFTLDNSQVREALKDYMFKQGYEHISGMLYGNVYGEAFAICQVRPLTGNPGKDVYQASTGEDKLKIDEVIGKI